MEGGGGGRGCLFESRFRMSRTIEIVGIVACRSFVPWWIFGQRLDSRLFEVFFFFFHWLCEFFKSFRATFSWRQGDALLRG